uniref:HCLS1-binding protein 3-like n=1 Tax=Ciona intestinalis TaxID=7719 RepID=UPI000180C8D5|nr:HCLS1-binding protein 3-like [Ciona intestinalis]|eukprot:XP_026692151.1 HCLS1-binding protein 3-like [Ciona intestinalis]
MPTRIATATVSSTRKLENTDTGLDVTVPECTTYNKEKREQLSSAQVIYTVVVVTNEHPALDKVRKEKYVDQTLERVAHFTLEKHYDEFLTLRKSLDKIYSGTYVPELPKKKSLRDLVASSSKTEVEARQRKAAVDKFMRWCSSNEKISNSEIVKSFLCLDIVVKDNQNESAASDTKTVKTETQTPKQIDAEVDLFGDTGLDYTKDSLFDRDTVVDKEELNIAAGKTSDEASELFLENDERSNRVTLFAKPDLTGNIGTGDRELLFYSDEENKNASIPLPEPSIGNEEVLLNVDDDVSSIFSKLRTVEDKPRLPTKRPILFDPTENEPSDKLDASKMEGNDLLQYITQNNEENAEVDLGF